MRLSCLQSRNRKRRLTIILGTIFILLTCLHLMLNSGETLLRSEEQPPVIESRYIMKYHYDDSFFGRLIHRIENFIDSASNPNIVDRNKVGKYVDPRLIHNRLFHWSMAGSSKNPSFKELNIKDTSGRYGTYMNLVDEKCLRDDCIYNESSPNIWARQKILVKKVQQPIEKTNNPQNNEDHSVKSEESNANFNNETHFELLLTPPIIMKWADELGFALSEGSSYTP